MDDVVSRNPSSQAEFCLEHQESREGFAQDSMLEEPRFCAEECCYQAFLGIWELLVTPLSLYRGGFCQVKVDGNNR